MKLTHNEVLALQDKVGNASLALKHLHTLIREDLGEDTLTEIKRIGKDLMTITDAILKSHKPLTFRGKL